jgi:hypothetical protein
MPRSSKQSFSSSCPATKCINFAFHACNIPHSPAVNVIALILLEDCTSWSSSLRFMEWEKAWQDSVLITNLWIKIWTQDTPTMKQMRNNQWDQVELPTACHTL